MGILRLKSLSEAEKDELMHMVLQQLTYQAKESFAKADVITLGILVKLIELSIATLSKQPAIQEKLSLELNTLKIQQLEKDMSNNK